jgi:hypothetical protein
MALNLFKYTYLFLNLRRAPHGKNQRSGTLVCGGLKIHKMRVE